MRLFSRFGASGRNEWSIFILSVVVLGSWLVSSSIVEMQETVSRETSRLTNQTTVAQQLIAHQLDAINDTLLVIRRNLTGHDGHAFGLDRQSGYLSTLVDAIPNIRTIIVLDAKGVARSSDKAVLIGSNFKERAYFREAQSHPDPDILYVSPPFKTVLGEWTLNLTRAMVAPDGTFEGIVTTSLDGKEFRVLLDSIGHAADAWTFLAHEDGTLFLADPDKPALRGMNPDAPLRFFAEHATSLSSVTTGRYGVSAANEQRMVAVTNLRAARIKTDKVLKLALASDIEAAKQEVVNDALNRGKLFALLVSLCGISLFVVQRRRSLTEQAMAQSDIKLREAQSQLEQFFTLAPDLLCIVKFDGTFLKVNPSWSEVLGYRMDEMPGKKLTDYIHPEDMAATLDVIGDLSEGRRVSNFVTRYRHRDGSYRYVEWHAASHEDVIYGSAYDVTKRKEHEREIQFMAYHDRLTGLPNRALFLDRFTQAISHAKRSQNRIGLLFLDLDGFKQVNDHYGHDAGDEVLKVTASRLQALLRSADTVARTGGDEFLIVLLDIESPEAPGMVCEKIIESLSQDIVLEDGQKCHVGASVGIAIFPDHGSDIESLLLAADAAMYMSKREGKNSYTFYQETVSAAKQGLDEVLIDNAPSVRDDTIDRQHQHLAELVNLLAFAINAKSNKEEIYRLFDELANFTSFHFGTENELMRRYEYPGRESHEQSHGYLLREIAGLRAELDQGGDLLIVKSIKDWLVHHIVSEDMPLGLFLSTRTKHS